LSLDPFWLDTVVSGNWHVHFVTASHHFQPTIPHIRRVHGQQNCQVIDLLDVSIGNRVNVWRKTTRELISRYACNGLRAVLTTPSELVVDLLLEE
jgi:hypothetical protein